MKRGIGTQFVAIFVSLLLALSMTPVFDAQSAFADESAERPATTGGDVPLEGPAENTGLGADGNAEEADGPVTATVREDGSLVANGLIYKSEGDGATLIGFEDGASLEREVSVPEKLTDGALEYTVKGVSIAEGQTAPGVLALELPQTVEDVDTKSLAAAMPALARVSVDGRGGAYSSANGMLFKQESITASSDGSTTRIANRELVWAPPAMVIARVPGTCKTVASGAFTDDKALETVMVFSIVESVAKAEKEESGNITKEGAFTDEQVSRVNIVTPMETLIYPEGDRISTDAFLAEDAPLNEKHIPWCDCGFSMERFTVGIPYGSTSLAVAVPEDGKVGTPEITIGHYTDHPEWDPKGETGEPENGLVFEYKADMTVSVSWRGDKAAVPSHLELPAYVVENGVKTAVTEVAPNAFEGATQLESVVVPEGVATIGESVFAGCSGLKSASLPSTLKTIDYAAFRDTDVQLASMLLDASVGGETKSNNYELGDFELAETSELETYGSNRDLDAYGYDYSLTIEMPSVSAWSAFSLGDSLDWKSIGQDGYYRYLLFRVPDSAFVGFVEGEPKVKSLSTSNAVKVITTPTLDSTSDSKTLNLLQFTPKPGWRFSGYSVRADEPPATYSTWGQLLSLYPKKTNFVISIQFDKDTTYNSTNFVTPDALSSSLADYARLADFGTISYEGLDGVEAGDPLPTSYIKGVTLTLPDPKREGSEFLGWTWSGQGDPAKGEVSSAFSSGGNVTLTANWKATAPAADYFFSGGTPLDAGGGDQSHVIKVRITKEAGKSLSSVTFKDNDTTHLLDKSKLGNNMFWVNGSEAAPTGDMWTHWGGTITRTIELVDVGDGYYGLYVGIEVPSGAVNQDSVMKSYTAGDYVASLVTLEYTFA